MVDRRQLVSQLRASAPAIAARSTEEFFAEHPDWDARFGSLGRERCAEDARFHLDFLVAAVEAGGDTAPFEAYARWTREMLAARGIAAQHLREHFQMLERILAIRLDEPEGTLVGRLLTAGARVCDEPAAPGAAADPTQTVFLQAILAGNRRGAAAIVTEALRVGATLDAVYADVLQPALYAVGRLWETNRITVAHEHVATAVVEYVMAHAAAMIPAEPRTRRMIVTGVRGELHQVGAHMIADTLEVNGCAVRFLGTNLPDSAVVSAAEEHAAESIGISVTILPNLIHARSLTDALRARLPAARIVVGGAAFRSAPTAWREIGADAVATDLRAGLTAMGVSAPQPR